ncbi:MAG: hypothetical protein HQ402_00035 [Parcubacteria group bacterium]|nr:hypothetical protein [Parcubacteria group bacterium]
MKKFRILIIILLVIITVAQPFAYVKTAEAASSGMSWWQMFTQNYQEERADQAAINANTCFNPLRGIFNISVCTRQAAGIIAEMILRLMSLLLYLAGMILNKSVEWTILAMKVPTSVDAVWKTFRDLANMFFIFILMYVAIMTILRKSGTDTKKLLTYLIVVAALLNFSLFFTKAVIDVSNTITITFYNKMVPPGSAASITGISGAFVEKLGLTSIYEPQAENAVDAANSGASTWGSFTDASWSVIFVTGIFGSIFILVASFVFAATAVLFIIRYIILIILLMLSPLAFMTMALPQDDYSKRWWDQLWKQAIFAPVCMMLLYAVLQFLGDPSIGLAGGDLKTALSGGAIDGMFNFVIIIGFMIAVLLLAQEVGAKGAGKALSMGKSARKWGQGVVGRNTAGRVASFADKKLENTAFGQSRFGSRLRDVTTGGVAGMKFGSKESMKDVDKKNKKIDESRAKWEEKKMKDGAEKNVKTRLNDVTTHETALNEHQDYVNSPKGRADRVFDPEWENKQANKKQSLEAGLKLAQQGEHTASESQIKEEMMGMREAKIAELKGGQTTTTKQAAVRGTKTAGTIIGSTVTGMAAGGMVAGPVGAMVGAGLGATAGVVTRVTQAGGVGRFFNARQRKATAKLLEESQKGKKIGGGDIQDKLKKLMKEEGIDTDENKKKEGGDEKKDEEKSTT